MNKRPRCASRAPSPASSRRPWAGASAGFLAGALAFASLLPLPAVADPLPAVPNQPQTALLGTASGSAKSPEAVITAFDDVLLHVMKNAGKLGIDGRYRALEAPIENTFNIPFMTRVVVGPDWAQWSDLQRRTVTEAFGKFIISTYARRFDGYSGESFEDDGVQPLQGGMVVLTRILRPHDEPVTLNYVMRRTPASNWQVVDVFLTGTISELATRRSEFAAVLERAGYDGLLKALAEKAKAANP